MKLVSDVKECWTWFSVQIALAGTVLQAAIIAFPDLKDWLGDTATHIVGIAILLGIIFGRVIDQAPKKAP